MAKNAERDLKNYGQTSGCADHDHDLVHELSRRLDMIWRYDQYVANAEWREDQRQFWLDMKAQEQENIKLLKELLKQEVADECF